MLSWVGPGAVTLLIAAVAGLLLLGTPGMIIMPWRTCTYGSDQSDPSSIGNFGSGGVTAVTMVASGALGSPGIHLNPAHGVCCAKSHSADSVAVHGFCVVSPDFADVAGCRFGSCVYASSII